MGKAIVCSFFLWGGGGCNLQACDCVAVWIGGCIIGDGLDDSRRDHVYGEEGFAEARVLHVDRIHVTYCFDEGWDVDLVKAQAEDAVQAPFDASDGIDAKSGRGLDIFPGDHGDVFGERPKKVTTSTRVFRLQEMVGR